MRLTTRYLGFDLRNPFLVGASPLINDLDMARRLEDAGAAALVMHSLFEEQIIRDNIRGIVDSETPQEGIYPDSGGFPLSPETYLNHIQLLKKAVQIPVIASLNGIHNGTWVDYAKSIQSAGADALELNLYFTPRSDADTSNAIEKTALNIVRSVRECVQLPLAVKISPFYTGLPRFVSRLEETGAQAVVLFNSFFQADIDIESVAYTSELAQPEPYALLLRTRWLATLHGRTRLELSLSGGVSSPEDAVKGLMAGATTIQMVSSLLDKGPGFLKNFIDVFSEWLERHEYSSVDQIRGLLGFQNCTNTEAMARASYLKMLQSWDKPA